MSNIHTELLVIGAGPGGYAAAFYAAAHGKKVLLVEQDRTLGGVCLNRGCIPSKALLSATKLIDEAKDSSRRGISFGEAKIDLAALRQWKESVVEKLSGGVRALAKARNVEVLGGRAYFQDGKTVRVETTEGQKFVTFEKAIIAVGSKPALPKAFDLGNKRIMTSTEALELEDIPKDLLVVGGGYIGMELGTVYAALGSKVVVVEAMGSILAGADADLARPVMRYAEKHFKEVRLSTKVSKMSTSGKQIKVSMDLPDGKKVEELYDKVLVSVGREPNCYDLGLKNTKIERDEKAFIKVDAQQQTSEPNIYAIGDCAGGLLLAHKASKEARIAVENILGEHSRFENVVIPAVVYTHPEVAWCGLTESEARAKNIPSEVSRFNWAVSGRALAQDKGEGVTKLLVDPETERVLGVGICGDGAGELISEGVLAIEMGATVRDLAETVHPHPTLSETIMEAAEVFYGYSTHMVSKRRAQEVEA